MRTAIRIIALCLTLVAVLTPAVAVAGQNVLTWTDNSSAEQQFNIERTTAAAVSSCQTAVGFVAIANVGINITTFTDAAAPDGVASCYRVNASNADGSSGWSNVAGRFIPLAAPSNLVVQ